MVAVVLSFTLLLQSYIALCVIHHIVLAFVTYIRVAHSGEQREHSTATNRTNKQKYSTEIILFFFLSLHRPLYTSFPSFASRFPLNNKLQIRHSFVRSNNQRLFSLPFTFYTISYKTQMYDRDR